MNETLRNEIIKDSQIKKFCLYGFLKNLKFFEPYLLLYLMASEITLFQIGLLIAIREVIVNVFEVPSGLIADYFGRKKEMMLCFAFYISSFVVFFWTDRFAMAVLAMALFGLGEAFRSGTHKAMIYTYLDHHNWQKEKAFVYGRTRSFSLMGSAVSSVLGIVFILSVPADRYIFLFSVIPYVLDFLLMMSYPDFLDHADQKQGANFKEMTSAFVASFQDHPTLRHLLMEEGIAEASFSYAKDFIQPILEAIVIGSGLTIFARFSPDDNVKILLGLIYAVLNFCGSFFSKRAYLIKGERSSMLCLYGLHMAYAVAYGLLAVFSGQYIMVCLLYLLVFMLHNVRKPLFVDEVDRHMDKSSRATVMSVAAQLKSLCLMIFAPLLGLIADTIGIGWALFVLCMVFVCTIRMLKEK